MPVDIRSADAHNENRDGNLNVLNVLSVARGEIKQDIALEATYDPRTKRGALVKWEAGEIETVHEYAWDGVVYRPLVDRLVRAGHVLLPTQYVEPRPPRDLLNAVGDAIHRYVDVSSGFEKIAARYALLTWFFDRFEKIPYLRGLGAFGSGKSRLLKTLQSVCFHSIDLGTAYSDAILYRVLAKYPGGTLFLDEADLAVSDMRSVAAKILNGGYQRGGVVMRCSPQDYSVQAYKSFSPKVIASRYPFADDALESRIVSEVLCRTERPDLPLVVPDVTRWEEMVALRNELMSLRLKNYDDGEPIRQVAGLERYNARFREIVSPLFQVIHEEEVPEDLQGYLNDLDRERRSDLGHGDEALVARALIEQCAGGNRPLVGAVGSLASRLSGASRVLSAKEAGTIVRSLGLATRKTERGYVVLANEQQLRSIADRYGLPYRMDHAA